MATLLCDPSMSAYHVGIRAGQAVLHTILVATKCELLLLW